MRQNPGGKAPAEQVIKDIRGAPRLESSTALITVYSGAGLPLFPAQIGDGICVRIAILRPRGLIQEPIADI